MINNTTNLLADNTPASNRLDETSKRKLFVDTNPGSGEKSQSNNSENELEILADDLKKLEDELLPQLNELDEKIPEIYSGYAELVRKTVSAALNVVKFDGASTKRIATGAELLARGMEAFGKWKAAKKHNELLDRILRIKKTIAASNMTKIERLQIEAKRSNKRTEAMVMKFASTEYPCSTVSKESLTRISSLMIRAITLYRTSLFLLELGNYLKIEYGQWLNDKQTSGIQIPDYYAVNGIISNKLFGDKPFDMLEKCADKTGNMSGAEIMLLSDSQLTLYSLKDSLCTISPENASAPVRILMDNNPSFQHYCETVEPLISHVSKTPDQWIIVGWLCTAIVVILLCIFYIPGTWWIRTIIGVSGVIAASRIYIKGSNRIKLHHCTYGNELFDIADDQISMHCGKIKRNEMDYEYKNSTSAFITGFLNS